MSIKFSFTLKTVLALLMALFTLPCGIYHFFNPETASPIGFSEYSEKEGGLVNGDYYVSPNGSDSADGSLVSPFATIDGARDAVRRLDKSGRDGITVCLMAGDYRTKGISFTREDSGTADCPITYCAYGDGEVILNGGVTLKSEDFKPVSGEARSRLSSASRVVEIDLTAYGMTADDWGEIYGLGGFSTASMYDGGSGPTYCELFMNDSRMTIARYPNDNGFLGIETVVDLGEVGEYPPQNYFPDFYSIRNPRGGTFAADDDTAARAARWKTIDDVWLYGYFYWDWADMSSPLAKLDGKNITMGFTSNYGLREGAKYYFFNVLEELDAPGEYYLDRDTGMLYFYPVSDISGAVLDLSLLTDSILTVNADYLTFDGLTVKGTRADGMAINGRGNTVRHCTIKNCAGNALNVSGSDNLVSENELAFLGESGVILSGGDKTTLTHCNNVADNNSIHDYGQIYLTYTVGVSLNGVGCTASHNEIFNAPHMAIFYSGNEHLIEYNLIHDVVLQSSDAGAIYAGRDWTSYGNVLRYNCIHDIGSGEFTPSGIYFDDALSGQTAYGNLLVNVPGNAFLIGGGREIKVYNNIIINVGTAISYDQRARDGAISDGWFSHHVETLESDMWVKLFNSPYKTELWAGRYPLLAAVTSDFGNPDNPNFAPNPSFSLIENNIVLEENASLGNIADDVYRFSTVGKNAVYRLWQNPGFADKEAGDYSLLPDSRVFKKLPDFQQLPIDKIGRY